MTNINGVDRVERTIRKDGFRVVSEQIKTVRSISLGVWVKTGSRHESDDLAGITHFLEHMLFKGTEKRNAFDIALSMEAVGGYLNAFTSNEYTCYYTRCLDTELELAFDVLSDMVLHSTFPAEEIEKEKKVVIEEMKMYRDSPDDFVFEAFTSHLFDQHPLGRPIIGFENTVSSFSRENLQHYVHERYNPSNILVSIAGNASHEQVTGLSDRYFSFMKNGETTDIQVPLTPYHTARKELRKQIEQAHYIIGKRSIGNSDVDRFKLLLANTVLGGGMSSRLHQNIREKYGYCYSVNSFNHSFVDTGMFGVYTGTDSGYVDHVRELVFAEFDRLRSELVPEKELNEAKSQLKGKMLLAQESMSNRMMRLAKSEIYYGRFVTLDELVDNIDGVTAGEIRDFAADFFKTEDFSETLLLPENKSS
jgi:predicted Zn-dependent peptidase